jgi:hypothetical protein
VDRLCGVQAGFPVVCLGRPYLPIRSVFVAFRLLITPRHRSAKELRLGLKLQNLRELAALNKERLIPAKPKK